MILFDHDHHVLYRFDFPGLCNSVRLVPFLDLDLVLGPAENSGILYSTFVNCSTSENWKLSAMVWWTAVAAVEGEIHFPLNDLPKKIGFDCCFSHGLPRKIVVEEYS